MRIHLFVLTCVCALLLSLDASALSNEPSLYEMKGDVIGEVSASYEDLHVTSATLNIEMLASDPGRRTSPPVKVTSTYQIKNRGESGDFDLFYFGNFRPVHLTSATIIASAHTTTITGTISPSIVGSGPTQR